MKQLVIHSVVVRRAQADEAWTKGELNLVHEKSDNELVYFFVDHEELTSDHRNNLGLAEHDESYNLILKYTIGARNSFVFQDLDLELKETIEIFKPKQLNQIPYEKPRYVPIDVGQQKFYVQREGFTVIVSPTGGGKTYTAIKNLDTLSKNFHAVLYLNLEIPDRDILARAILYLKDRDKIADNIFVANSIKVNDLKGWVNSLTTFEKDEYGETIYQEKSICVIIDNIDNLVSSGDSAFETQLNFITEFDSWAKEDGHLGIFLSQFVKEGARNGILKKDPDGGKMIDPDISHNQLSGVKQIATLSRSVIMTYFDGSSNYVKILKKGSGKFENELNAEDWSTFNL